MFRIQRSEFFRAYQARFPKPALTSNARQGMGELLSRLESDVALDGLSSVAYMLATVKHECANRWNPVTEFGARAYFEKYDAGTPIGARLGNTRAGDGFRFRGRGYVQITGRRNYAAIGQRLGRGRQLVDDPDLALQPEVAYAIMSYGMRNGTFTGRKLEQFISPGQRDYVNARKIINGLDQASRIAEYARTLEQMQVEHATARPAEVDTPEVIPPSPSLPVAGVAAVPLVEPVRRIRSSRAPTPLDAFEATATAFGRLGLLSGWG